MNKLNILYEDNHIIVVVKERNILSQSDNTKDKDLLTMVKEYIKEKYHKSGNVYLGLIHRLDRPVSGVMVFARTSKAASRLSQQVRDKTMKKKYWAVVHGIINEEEGVFVDFLKREKNGNTVITDSKNGKESILSYKVLDRNYIKKETLVDINLETGRHHQIRVQFASRGFPLCGDQRYGIVDKTPIALCAYQLEFIHPTTKQIMVFNIDRPKLKYWDDFKM